MSITYSFRSSSYVNSCIKRRTQNLFAKESKDKDKYNIRDEDLEQLKDLDLILSERAKRFYAPTTNANVQKESCILLSVDSKLQQSKSMVNTTTEDDYFTFEESLSELSELVGTAGLQVLGTCIQRLQAPNSNSYINSGKAIDVMSLVNSTGAKTIVVDDDLSPKQQRNLVSCTLNMLF